MLDEKLKQRLVGAAVLVSLAIIFLPSLFYKEKRVEIDTTTQIPPAPAVEPVQIAKLERPKDAQAPPFDKLFQPDPEAAVTETNVKNPPAQPEAVPEPTKKPEQPRLNAAGVPVGWVVQVASFKSNEAAQSLLDKLIKADYRAYQQPVTTAKGEFFRVLIGPFIEEQRARTIKSRVDKAYKVQSRVLRFNPVSGD